MNLLQRKNLVVCCLLGLTLTLSAQAGRYSVWTPITVPDITVPVTGSSVVAGADVTLQCQPVGDYDYDNWTCSTIYDGATVTWTAKDDSGNDVGEFIDNQGTTGLWKAPMAGGEVKIYATADDNPYCLANDPPQQHYHTVNIIQRAYVKYDAVGANSGTSWYDAFTHLEDALALGSGWEIWVAQGTYYPGDSQTDTFNISGAAVYGGFYGNETLREQRSPSTYVTILSGDIGESGLNTDNCHRVVSLSDGTLDGFTVEQGYGAPGGYGAGMCVAGAATITDCIIRNNRTSNGGDLHVEYAFGAGVYCAGGSPTFTGCEIADNIALDDGGGVALMDGASATFSDCYFLDNEAVRTSYPEWHEKYVQGEDRGYGGDGGGVYIPAGCNASFDEDCVFEINTARDDGGGVYVEGCSPSFNGCSFVGNKSGEDGGAASNKTSEATYTNCTFTGNEAGDDGGAMCWKDGGNGSVSGASTLFSGNHAASNGGAVFISAGDNDQEDPDVGSSPSFSGCTFSGNWTDTDGKDGGAVNCKQSGSNPTFSSCAFYGNHAEDDGGAIQCEDEASMTISDCVFATNTCGGNGGAIRASQAVMVFHACVFVGNEADGNAGAVQSVDASDVDLFDSVFAGNSCDGEGGAIRNGSSGTTTEARHCTFYGNAAGTVGGAIQRAKGGVTVEDSILWANTAPSGGAQISGTATVTYSDVQAAEVWPGEGNINGDPLFHDPGDLLGGDELWFTIDDGLVLQSGSPCRNAASDDTHMGAYQY
jgi:predicted outer membrane repeat protein